MKTRAPLAFAIALINASLALPAVAADTTPKSEKPTDDRQLEEVVVTATKRETNLMQTPIAVTVIDDKTLERQGITNAKDITRLVPNMDLAIDSSRNAPVISMRGVRSTNNTELGDPAVGLHLDGVYSPRPQGAMALMFDTERVEALRGPQGTLFGRNSTVGSINIINKRPELDSFDANVGVELGRWNERQIHGMVNIPVSDTFALRASFQKETRDSYLDGIYDPNQWNTRMLPDYAKNTGAYTGAVADKNKVQRENWWSNVNTVKADPADFYNNVDQYAFRIAGLWKPSDEFSWLLTYEKFQNSGAGTTDTVDCKKARKQVFMQDGKPAPLQGCENIYGPGADEYTVAVNVPGMLDQTIDSLRSNIRWDFSDDMSLVYNAGAAKQTQNQLSDLDRGTSWWDMTMFFDGATYKSQSHELQLESTGDSKLQWITGLFLFKEDNNMQGGMTHSSQFSDYWNQKNRTLESVAGFAQGTYELTDDLSLTVGYRHTQDTKEDVGGHGEQCADWAPNQADPTANGGKCFPAWDRDAFNKLPADYFKNEAIYTITGNNDNKGTWDYDNYRLGLDYQIDSDTMVFGYVANGTKSGGIGDVILQNKQDPLTTETILGPDGKPVLEKRWATKYDPEEVVTWEAGIKSDLFDHTLRLTASVFFSDYTDMQVSSSKPLFSTYVKEMDPQTQQPTGKIISNAVYSTVTDNIGKALIKGLELEFDWAVTANDRINGFATYLDTEIVSDFQQQWAFAATDLFQVDNATATNPNNKDLSVNLKGSELPSSPRFTLNLNYTHTFKFDSGATLAPWLGFNWRAESYYSFFNVDKHTSMFKTTTPEAYSDVRPASHNLNLGLKYSAPGDKWNIETFVNNATNEVDFYWAGGGDGTLKGPVSMPRFYGVRTNFHF
ncbi:MAG: TonB-dependent receptor [Gammaproteobacteria bacterium]|nr:MAG: TonB-dependent receptor [Gammaproteobacteria bacterium]